MYSFEFFRTTGMSALQNLYSAPLRTALSLIGIVVGCAIVVAMLHIGLMSQRQILSQLQEAGLDLAVVSSNEISTDQFSAESYGAIEAELESLPGVERATIWTSTDQLVTMGDSEYQINFIEATPGFQKLTGLVVRSGDYKALTESENLPVVFTPTRLQSYSGGSIAMAVGDILRVGLDGYRITGTFEPGDYNPLLDIQSGAMAIVPKGALRRVVRSSNLRWSVVLELDRASKEKFSTSQVLEYFNDEHSAEVYITQAENLIQAQQSQTQQLSVLMACLGGISLFVGSIGIANVMLASVAERRTEIGLRVALGATPTAVMALFLIEAMVLCSIGGIVGVLLGLIVSWLYAVVASTAFVLSFKSILLALIVSIAGGLLSGFIPARKSANLDPVSALQQQG